MKRGCYVNKIVFGFFVMCLSVPISAQEKTKAVIDLKIGGDESDEGYFVGTSVASDQDGNIYIADAKQWGIIKYDDKGRFVKRVGKPGQGPGEFPQSPQHLRISGGKLYVIPKQMPLILIYDLDLHYLKMLKSTCGNITDFRLYHKQIYISTVDLPSSEKNPIILLNEKKSKWDNRDRKGPGLSSVPWASMKVFDIDQESGDFVVASKFEDNLERWNKKEKLVWRSQLFDGQKIVTRDMRGRKIPDFETSFFYNGVVIGKHGLIFVLSGRRAKHPQKDVYVLSHLGKLVTTFALAYRTPYIAIDEKGCLYAWGEDEGQIIRYRLVEES